MTHRELKDSVVRLLLTCGDWTTVLPYLRESTISCLLQSEGLTEEEKLRFLVAWFDNATGDSAPGDRAIHEGAVRRI